MTTVDFLVTPENTTTGALTTAKLTACDSAGATWTISTGTPATFATVATQTRPRLRAPVVVNGSPTQPLGTQAFAFRLDQFEYAERAIASKSVVTIGCLWQPFYNPLGFTFYDPALLHSASDYAVVSLQETGSGAILKAHTQAGVSGTSIAVPAIEYNWLCIQFKNGGLAKVALFDIDNNYAQIGSDSTLTIPTAGNVDSFRMGEHHTPSSPTVGTHYFGDIIGVYTDVWPLIPEVDTLVANVTTLNATTLRVG